ncbi:MAG: single-stranded-DNA-specific exonuclease RecJ, partial [Ruminococcus sp.]|nr:single-stranded-DNA-specific exonuclease RecJ [Ruminococcus sp.]
CVYGDYDADGVTSTALLYSYLETVGANVMYYIPSRENEGYGMNMKAVDFLNEKGVNLIVTVDNGISAIDEISYAKSLGIETVVTDHHMPSDTLPDAVAVVDMHRSDCKSRFKSISGVGVAFKLVMAIEGEYADVDMLLDNYSDIITLGTIGDVMPLVDENRVFVKRGLRNINNGDRQGIASLAEHAGLSGKKIYAENLSFTIVPRINAVGRLGQSDDCVNLLITDDYERADEIARNLSDNNFERQKIEKEILEKINILIAKNPSLVQDRVLIIDGKDWHQGVIGIVSSRLRDIYGKPCIILSEVDGICKGSGRSVEGFDLWEAVFACEDIVDHFGGHKMAVGLGIEYEKIDEFRRKINEYAAKKGEMPYDTLDIDCKLNPAYLDVELAKSLSYLEPFGVGNPVPVFQLSKLKIASITPLSNNKHIRINLTSGNTHIQAIKFSCPSYDFQYKIGDIVDLAVNLDVNVYRNTESLSVKIKDIKYSDVENVDYIHSLRVFEYFCSGESVGKEDLNSIIPDRNDFALVYRYLKQQKNLTNLSLDVIVHGLSNKVSYGKLKVILEAMNELKLIALYEDMYKIEIKMLDVASKVNLEDASIIKSLKEVYRNE